MHSCSKRISWSYFRMYLERWGINFVDVKHISINQDPKVNFFKQIIYVIKIKPKFNLLLGKLCNKIEKMYRPLFKKISRLSTQI